MSNKQSRRRFVARKKASSCSRAQPFPFFSLVALENPLTNRPAGPERDRPALAGGDSASERARATTISAWLVRANERKFPRKIIWNSALDRDFATAAVHSIFMRREGGWGRRVMKTGPRGRKTKRKKRPTTGEKRGRKDCGRAGIIITIRGITRLRPWWLRFRVNERNDGSISISLIPSPAQGDRGEKTMKRGAFLFARAYRVCYLNFCSHLLNACMALLSFCIRGASRHLVSRFNWDLSRARARGTWQDQHSGTSCSGAHAGKALFNYSMPTWRGWWLLRVLNLPLLVWFRAFL